MRILAKLLKFLLSMALGAGILLALVGMGAVEVRHTGRSFSESRSAIAKEVPQSSGSTSQAGPTEPSNTSIPMRSADPSEPDKKYAGPHKEVLSYVRRLVGDGAGDAESQLRRYLENELSLGREKTERFVRMCFWKNFTTLIEQWPRDHWRQRLTEFEHELALKSAGFRALGLELTQKAIAEARVIAQQMVNAATRTDQRKGAS